MVDKAGQVTTGQTVTSEPNACKGFVLEEELVTVC